MRNELREIQRWEDDARERLHVPLAAFYETSRELEDTLAKRATVHVTRAVARDE